MTLLLWYSTFIKTWIRKRLRKKNHVTTARTRTVNLLLRRQAPCPLGHSGLYQIWREKIFTSKTITRTWIDMRKLPVVAVMQYNTKKMCLSCLNIKDTSFASSCQDHAWEQILMLAVFVDCVCLNTATLAKFLNLAAKHCHWFQITSSDARPADDKFSCHRKQRAKSYPILSAAYSLRNLFVKLEKLGKLFPR